MKKILFTPLVLLFLSTTAQADPVDYVRARKVAVSAIRLYDIELAAMSKTPADTAAWWNALPVTVEGVDNVYLFNVFR